MAQQRNPTLPACAGGAKAERKSQQVGLLKSLEYLYAEASGAKMSLVATLIGAAVEAVKDEIGGIDGATRVASPSVVLSLRNFTANQMLTDDEDLDDEIFFRDDS